MMMNISITFMKVSLTVSQARPGLFANGIESNAHAVMNRTHFTSVGSAVSVPSLVTCDGT